MKKHSTFESEKLAQQSRHLAPSGRKLLQERISGIPVWIRSPKQGVEFYCGCSRSKLYELANSGHIRSVSIREPGQVKGTRLFHLQSILDFIARCEAQANAAGVGDTDGDASRTKSDTRTDCGLPKK